MHAHTHARTHTRARTHTHTHTHTCTHAHTHTHTGVLVQLLMKLFIPTEKELCTGKIKINVKCTHFKQGAEEGVGWGVNKGCGDVNPTFLTTFLWLIKSDTCMQKRRKKEKEKSHVFLYV